MADEIFGKHASPRGSMLNKNFISHALKETKKH